MTSFLKNMLVGAIALTLAWAAVYAILLQPWLLIVPMGVACVWGAGSVVRYMWHERTCPKYYCLGPDDFLHGR